MTASRLSLDGGATFFCRPREAITRKVAFLATVGTYQGLRTVGSDVAIFITVGAFGGVGTVVGSVTTLLTFLAALSQGTVYPDVAYFFAPLADGTYGNTAV